MKPFYERNSYVLNDPINVLYEDIVSMTDLEFEQWVIRMRKVILNIWDTHGCPPRTGKNEDEIIDEFNKMVSYPIHLFEFTDELTNTKDVIINKSRVGSEADQFFSNMYKTRINYSENDTGYSIYDLFADDKYLPRMIKGARRHIRRDSFYNFALSAIKNDAKYSVISVPTGDEWMQAYFTNPEIFNGYDFILEKNKKKSGLNTGYFQLEQSKILSLDKDLINKWKSKLSYRHYSTFEINSIESDDVFHIRVYEKGQKVFPKCFPSFRIGYIQPAVNFPPLTAKFLYEKYTCHITGSGLLNIYDPSSGWGGRLLGCMSMSDRVPIHYIGTDPNSENWFGEGSSKYHNLANFYNTKTYRGNSFFSDTHTFEMHQYGSEEIGKHIDRKVDLVFTSPPYFNREAYSNDPTQSYKKFSSYESWRDGFLRPTLETCVRWLKNDRYLLWNIADIQVAGKYLPLEKDSRDILESLGMKYVETMKMAMEGMPGQNRLDEDGKPKCKNFCKVQGTYLKYEPVFVFYKTNGEEKNI